MVEFISDEEESNIHPIKLEDDPWKDVPDFAKKPFYPCKIISIFGCPIHPDRLMALVHSTDYLADDLGNKDQKDSGLVQRFKKEYGKQPVSGPFKGLSKPCIRIINIDSISERIMVVEDSPGCKEHVDVTIEKDFSPYVSVMKPVYPYWGEYFEYNKCGCNLQKSVPPVSV